MSDKEIQRLKNMYKCELGWHCKFAGSVHCMFMCNEREIERKEKEAQECTLRS